MTITLTPIGFVRTTRVDPVDDNWHAETTRIELDANQFTPDALLSLDHFSPIDVIYSINHPESATPLLVARRPRGRVDWQLLAIFAQRAKNPANRIGLTVCKLIKLGDHCVHASGLDACDGTLVLDIKPGLTAFV